MGGVPTKEILIGKLNTEKNKTVVMVTHDIGLVNYANKAFHLKDGMVK